MGGYTRDKRNGLASRLLITRGVLIRLPGEGLIERGQR